ncbi:MAG TPA: glycerol-3-phosphate 1-O-acyltransferase PlsY [Clostridia bacterium]|nr:glycerol-3-phosphate 1-O-acyltransferase PlsY [Clostridia bacterium]
MSVGLIVLKALGTFLMAYALGCFSSAYFIGYLKHIDIREHGSGNAGSTNAMRVFGPGAGITVMVLDILKGLLATLIGYYIMKIGVDAGRAAEFSRYGLYLGGLGSVIGHIWPVNLGFRGGKGVATTFGAFLILEPWLALVLFVLFIITSTVSKLVSLASIGAVIIFCITMLTKRLLYPPVVQALNMNLAEKWILVAYMLVIAFIVIYSHRRNISRLINGKENKVDIAAAFKNFNNKEKRKGEEK